METVDTLWFRSSASATAWTPSAQIGFRSITMDQRCSIIIPRENFVKVLFCARAFASAFAPSGPIAFASLNYSTHVSNTEIHREQGVGVQQDLSHNLRPLYTKIVDPYASTQFAPKIKPRSSPATAGSRVTALAIFSASLGPRPLLPISS